MSINPHRIICYQFV